MLDEADRILDMGFRTQLDGILQYLPPRQTMLFSATQTKSVKDLARLSLNNPQYVAVHAQDKEVTPKQLLQNYVTVSVSAYLTFPWAGMTQLPKHSFCILSHHYTLHILLQFHSALLSLVYLFTVSSIND